MNPDWADFLARQTASPGTGASLPALFNDITQFSVLRFRGPDACAFLQGQLTCDVRALPADRWTWGAYCSAKGRVLANFMLWASENGYRMLLPQALAPAVAKRLRMFVLRSLVTLEDETGTLVLLGIGSGADASLALELKEPHRAFSLFRRGMLDALQLTQGRTLIVAALEDAKSCWTALQGKGHIEPASQWDRLSIAQGEPWVQPQTQDAFVPQMLNLEILDGVSFTKGCYPGQEIVARSQHLGEVKRRLYGFRATCAEAIAPGSSIFTHGGEAVGTVVNSAAATQGGTEILAVVQTAAPRARLHWGSGRGPRLDPCPLPYAVPGTTNG